MTSHAGPHTGRPPTYAARGMVATSHALASESGLHMLRRGGSAVDAAIAANAMLCVLYPHMAGLGGDGFWLVHDPREGAVRGLNASGPSARLATPGWYRERGHADRIPARGALAALTVPGAVDGWRAAHERWGRLPWAELFEDAVRCAREGAPVGRSLTRWIAKDLPEFEAHPEVGRVFLDGGRRRREGDRLVVPGLADSLALLARRGARGALYEGELAERICAALEPAGSPLRPDDFAAFRAEWVDPIHAGYRGHEVYQMPPNAQGFTTLQLLRLVEGFDVERWGDGGVDYYHHLAEASKLVLADRNAWLTDPRALDIPLDRLLSADYAARRRERIDAERAMRMDAVEPGLPDAPPAPPGAAGGDTCAFCAVDADGLAVSAIQSVFHDFGAMVWGGDTGILLQNRGSYFTLDERRANCLRPGKRTAHTLIPGMLLLRGEPVLVFGAMGGDGQPQTHAALLTRLLDFGYNVQQAIEAPRWLMGHTWGKPSQELNLEGRVDDEVLHRLLLRGQPVNVFSGWNDNLGHAQAIRLNRGGGFLEGGADPRGDGAALGY